MRSFFLLSMLFGALFVVSPLAAQQPKAPPKEVDITDNIRATIDQKTGQYYKLTGPFGKSYFVVGEDVALDRAYKVQEGRNVVTKIVLDVKEENRGAQFIMMPGTQIEFYKADDKGKIDEKQKPALTLISMNDQSVTYEFKGRMVVVLGRPIPPQRKAPPKK